MTFLDEIDKKLTRLGQGALQKTREVSDTAKLSATIRNLDSQKKMCLEKLGELFCSKYEIFAGEEELILIKKIRAIESEIKQQQDEVNRIKGVINCPKCHAEVPVNCKFCPSCGMSMELHISKIKQQEGIVCNRCGVVVSANQMFCMNCGNNLDSQQKAEDINTMSLRNGVEGVSKEMFTHIESENKEEFVQEQSAAYSMKCRNCGEEIEDGMAFCVYCGTAL